MLIPKISKISKKTKFCVIVVVLILAMIVGFFQRACIVDVIGPLFYHDAIKRFSSEYDIDPMLVAAVVKEESKFSKYALSPAGARGLMQVMPSTARALAKELEIDGYNDDMLYNPQFNIRLGSYYLAKLIKDFDSNTLLVLAAYNAGETNVRSWNRENSIKKIEDIPYPETKKFVRKVLRNYRFLKRFSKKK